MNSPEPPPPDSNDSEQQFTDRDRYPFHIDGTLYMPLECGLPVDTCICCDKPSVKTVTKSLRNPKSPLTWYSRVPKVEIGLCKKHAEDRGVACALTYSMLALGALLIGVAIFTFSVPTIAVGAIAVLTSGIFRARSPIQGRDRGDDIYEIRSAHESYVHQFPEHELVEE